jgi:hypothetical protein
MFDEYGVAEAAAVLDVPRPTISTWRHRGFAPGGPITASGVLELGLLRRLGAAGLGPTQGAEIARALRPLWASGLAPGSPRRHVVARRDPASGSWSGAVVQEGGLAAELGDGALLLDLRQLAEAVLERLGRRAA